MAYRAADDSDLYAPATPDIDSDGTKFLLLHNNV